MKFSEKIVSRILKVIQIFYLAVLVLFVLIVAMSLLLGKPIDLLSIVVAIFNLLFYLGIKKRKSWFIPVILFISSMTILSLLFFQPANNIEIISRILGLLLNTFYLFFFSRKEVVKTFKREGIFIW